MRRHFQQLQLDRSPLKLNNNNEHQQHHSFIGPIESFSDGNSPPQSSTVSYKKGSQSANISLANRYSYLMAVNTHPLPMKEHRL